MSCTAYLCMAKRQISYLMYGKKIYFSMLAYALLAFPEYINKISYHAGLLNFKKSHGDSDCSYGELFA